MNNDTTGEPIDWENSGDFFKYCDKCYQFKKEFSHAEIETKIENVFGKQEEVYYHAGCGGFIDFLCVPSDESSHAITISDYEKLSPKEQGLTLSLIRQEVMSYWKNFWEKSAEDTQRIVEQGYARSMGYSTELQCPVCGSYLCKRINTAQRVVSVGLFGLGSGKIGKQYKCDKCGHMW